MGLGMGELIVVLFIVLLFFGSKKLPQLGSSLGQSLKNFKKAIDEKKTDHEDSASSQIESKDNSHKKDS